MEIWKPIPSVQGIYEASSFGRIRRAQPGKNTQVGRIITQRNKKGTDYRRCRITVNGYTKDYSVHRLVCEAFHGESNLQVDHLNGNKSDNRPENLEWVTGSENMKRAYDRGYKRYISSEARQHYAFGQQKRKLHNPNSWHRGEQCAASHITEDKAREIIEHLSQGILSRPKIAKLCGVSYDIVRRIHNNQNWTHLSRF